MPEFVNTLEHPVRVQDENGQSVRVVPGQVITVDGATADRLSAIEGVNNATDEDRDAWAETRGGTISEVTSGKTSLEESASQARAEARMLDVVVPLNQVVGDDNAPIGPPSGTITTKSAVARLGGAEKRAFADHERLPEEQGNPRLNEVERAQAEAKALAEEVHADVLARASEAGLEAATMEPESTGALSTEGVVDTGDDESEPGGEEPLRGQALDDALAAKGLSTSGTVAQKQQRLADADG